MQEPNSLNKVALTYISALVGFLGNIVTLVYEYEQDKSICKYLILFRNEMESLYMARLIQIYSF